MNVIDICHYAYLAQYKMSKIISLDLHHNYFIALLPIIIYNAKNRAHKQYGIKCI